MTAGMGGGEAPRALVVFSGKADLAWLRLLRRGFRHCFVVVETESGWLCLNPLAHRTTLDIWRLGLDFDVVSWLRSRGLIVVETRVVLPPRRQAPVSLYSCVEAVKRVLGIHDGWILTPWQLYRHLECIRNNSLTISRRWVNNPTSTPQSCPDQPSSSGGESDPWVDLRTNHDHF